MTRTTASIEADIRILDTADQGVCPDGHPCRLTQRADGTFVRRCDIPVHRSRSTVAVYIGWPLIDPRVTSADLDRAEREGADPDLIEWARDGLADRP